MIARISVQKFMKKKKRGNMERGRLQFLDRVTRGQFFCSRYSRVIGIFLIAIYWTVAAIL